MLRTAGHLTVWLSLTTTALALSLAPPSAAASTDTDALPRVRVPRVTSGPVVDGSLDDAIWQSGVLLRTLIQSEPNQGEPISERTEIRLLRDANALYFGIRCYDSDPEGIVAQKMQRDESLNSEDRIAIAIDTFRDQRNGYFFQINPRGAKRDGLIENGSLDTNWDGIWVAAGRVDEQGWVLEIALPFKTFSFDPTGDEWGLKILRGIVRKGERARWAEPYPDSSFVNMAAAGVLEGMADLEVGWGLDVIPALAVRHIDDPAEDVSKTKVDPSLEAFYRVTPGLTGALTVNTDFAETAVDSQRVNLSRFPLFFPEKREFFLRDGGIFNFGGIVRNGRPFFSRKIGLDAGEPYDIHVGGKLTGRQGPLNIGLLNAYVSEHGDVSRKNLFVGRVSANVLAESQIGLIATHGNPACDVDNSLVGTDLLYRDSNFFPQRTLTGRLWYQRSFTGDRVDECGDQPEGAGASYGARIEYPNDKFNWALGTKTLEGDFFPALGFVSQPKIREYDGSFRYRVRPQDSRLQTADGRVQGALFTDIDNQLDSANATFFPIDLATPRGDGLEIFYTFQHDLLTKPLRISRVDVEIADVGRYSWHRGGVRFIVAESRALGGQLEVVYGGHYGGTQLGVKGLVRFRPSRHVFLSAEYNHTQFKLPDGDFAVAIARVRVNIAFSVDLSWNTLVQYDSVSDQISINSRLRWIIEPGRELFLVLNQTLLADGELSRGRTEPIIKLGWTFRY